MRAFRSRRFHTILFTWIGVLLLCAAPSQAQEAAERLRLGNERLVRLFSDLPVGRRVQIVTPLVRIAAGAFERVSEDSVVVMQDGVVVPVPLDHIRTVAVQSDHRLQGSLWGLSVGAVVGSVFGLMLGAFDCTSPLGCESSERDGALRWGTVVGVVGGGVGWVFGRRSVYWKPVFP